MPRISDKASTKKKPALRQDPPARATDDSVALGTLVGSDPERKYCWVPRYSRSGGVEFYQWQGWRVERRGASGEGVKLARGNSRGVADDDCISLYDCVLMSIDKEAHAEKYNMGQAKTDRIEKVIVDRGKGGIDPIRGVRGFPGVGDYYDVINNTSGERVERITPR